MFVSGRSPPPEPLTQSKTWCQSTDRRVLWCLLRSGNAGAHSTPQHLQWPSWSTIRLWLRTNQWVVCSDAYKWSARWRLTWCVWWCLWSGQKDGSSWYTWSMRARSDNGRTSQTSWCSSWLSVLQPWSSSSTFRRNGNLFSNHRVLIVFNLTRQRI